MEAILFSLTWISGSELVLELIKSEIEILNQYTLRQILIIIPLSTVVIFFYIGIGYRWYEFTYDGELEETGRSQKNQTSSGPGVKIGFNIFFNSHVALDIAASYWNLNWDLDNSSNESDTESRLYIPIIGLKVFF